tara:strand:+ start:1977 stop:2219 length:243 start_codon:yes stop_codon:yes gene_type:complete
MALMKRYGFDHINGVFLKNYLRVWKDYDAGAWYMGPPEYNGSVTLAEQDFRVESARKQAKEIVPEFERRGIEIEWLGPDE